MNWRNIHIKNTSSNQSLSSTRNHNKRYTPSKIDGNHSKQLFHSIYQNKQYRENKNDNSVFYCYQSDGKNNSKYPIYQVQIRQLKKKVHRLVKYSHSLCNAIKNYIAHLNKVLKNSTQTLKQQIEQQIQILLKKIPKSVSQNERPIHASSTCKTEGFTINAPYKPFLRDSCNFQQSLGSSIKINVSSPDSSLKNSKNYKYTVAQLANKKINHINKQDKDNNIIKQLYSDQDVNKKQKKKCITQSISQSITQSKINFISNNFYQQNELNNNSFNNHFQQDNQLNNSKQPNFFFIKNSQAKQRQQQSQTYEDVTFMDTEQKKKKHKTKLKNTQTTSHSQITNLHEFKLQRNQQMLINFSGLKNQQNQDKKQKQKYKQSKTQRICLYNSSNIGNTNDNTNDNLNDKKSYCQRKSSKNIQERIINLTNCIDNMKKILMKPA